MFRRPLRCEIHGESGTIGEDYHLYYGLTEEDLKKRDYRKHPCTAIEYLPANGRVK